MLFAEIDATGWGIIITAGVSAIGALVLQILQTVLSYSREKAKIIRDEEAAKKVEEVRIKMEEKEKDDKIQKETVAQILQANTANMDEKLENMSKVNEATHTLVNSNMGTQLNITALALRKVANLTKDPDDMRIATLAEQAYHDHEAKQKIVDDGKKIEPAVKK